MKRLTLRILKIAFVLLVLVGVPSVASADGLTWTLNGVKFGDWTTETGATIGTGGSASGSFIFDPLNPNIPYTDINVTTTTWATLSAPTIYTSLTPGVVSNSDGVNLGGDGGDFTDVSFLFLVFTDSLTNAGGTSPIDVTPGVSLELLCLDAGCDVFDERPVIAGNVSAPVTVTPEPAVFSLLGIGLLALLIGSATRKVVSA